MMSFVRVIGRMMALGLAVCAGAAMAADPATPPTEWSDITQVVVRAHIPGPAMWKLTKDGSTVWVLGVMDIKPEPLRWNSDRFKRILRGAKVLILPQESTWEPTNSALPKTQRLKDVVSPATYHRFEDVVTRDSLSTTTYDTYKPVWAGARLMSDVISDHEISTRIVPDTLPVFARDAGVPLQWLRREDAPNLLKLYDSFDPAGSEACFNAYLDSIDYLLGPMPKVTSAWARGDLTTVMKYHREMAYTTCILSDPTTAPVYRTYAIDNAVGAIDTALQAPGKSVAVWPLSDLLRKDGVLDRLRAEGVMITSPES